MQEMLQIRRTSPLFHLETAADVQNRVRFHNTGPGQVPGLIVMSISDDVLPDLDPVREAIVVLFNASDEAQTITVGEFAGRQLDLHPVQVYSADEVVKTSSFDVDTGAFTVPARTTAVFVERETHIPINCWLSLKKIHFSYDPTPVENAPAGVFTISTTFRNKSSRTFGDPFFKVVLLTGDNVVLNAYPEPGGKGAVIPVSYQALGGNGLWEPGEVVTIPFEIGLARKWPFLFLVSAYGIPVDGIASSALELEAATESGFQESGSQESGFQESGFEFDISEEDFKQINQQYLPIILK
jgi:hypothetical protein